MAPENGLKGVGMFKLQKSYFWLALAFLAGLLLGWLVIGWWLWPIQWVNTDPWDLKPEFKKHYILMAADSYALVSNPELLKARFKGWPPEDLAKLLNEIKRENPGNELLISRLETIRSALGLTEPAMPQPKAKGLNFLPFLRAILLFLVVLIVAGIGYRLLKSRPFRLRVQIPRPSTRPAPAPKPEVIEGEVRAISPLAGYSSTYTYGDIRFAESFPIEGAGEKYLGECGIEITELVASGDPPKAGAFEVWLFDKDLNRTVSKVIAIPRADEAMLATLRSYSQEIILAEKDKKFKLETDNLECWITIKDVALGDEGTFFTRLSVYFEIYKKTEG